MTSMMTQNQIELFYNLLSERLGEDRVTTLAQRVKLEDEVLELFELLDSSDFIVDDVIGEIADVMIVCLMMARTLGVGATAVFRAVNEKMRTNLQRSWYPTASGTARHTPEVVDR